MMALHQKYLSLMNAAAEAGAPSHFLRACFCLLSVARAIDIDCGIRLNKYKLSEGKFVLLFFLAQSKQGLAPTELARMSGVTKATVTGLSDGLVRVGLARRSNTGIDRRSFTLELTPKGRQVANQAVREHGVWIASLFDNLTSENLEQMESLLALVWQQTDEGKKLPNRIGSNNNKHRRENNAKNRSKV